MKIILNAPKDLLVMTKNKFKFVKIFSSFRIHSSMTSTKDMWYIALHDPAYLIIFGGALVIIMFQLIKIF